MSKIYQFILLMVLPIQIHAFGEMELEMVLDEYLVSINQLSGNVLVAKKDQPGIGNKFFQLVLKELSDEQSKC